MDDPNIFRTPNGKRLSPLRRYRVTVRGDVPANLIDVVAAVHAAMIAHGAAVLGPTDDEDAATDHGEAAGDAGERFSGRRGRK